ncbi:hypothetical protein [Beijerinckia sp. L45]|uniref:hypothetical protein n=1 Tax=Beijerinckia sp. L45 TaxID=1641855 RepID=UPI00131D1FA6|nr:hypothetical protein [Beijerinckia sp. L45]
MMKFSTLIGAAATLALASAGFVPAQAAEGPFSNFSGVWSGTGTVTVKNGTKERLRCKAHYEVSGGGESMAQNLTCASDSYTFNVVANVKAAGSAISGNWQETSRGANGEITGHIDPRQISATVEGVGFTAGIAIAARGGKQSVNIRPTGTDITDVSVTMSKS